MNVFVVSVPNEYRERKSYEFELGFKKPFICRSNKVMMTFIHSFIHFYLPYIYNILQFKVGIMRLKKVNGEET